MLTNAQRVRVRALAMRAHDAGMRTEGLRRVRDESDEFLRRLLERKQKLERELVNHGHRIEQLERHRNAGRLTPEEFAADAAPHLEARAIFADLEGQITQAKAERQELNERLEASNAVSAPQNELLDQILRHARVTAEDLGIDFHDRTPDIVRAVTVANSMARSAPTSARGSAK